MKQTLQIREFCVKNRKVITVVLSAVLAVLFIGSILLAVFIGGEFGAEEEAPVTVKGKMSLNSAEYKTVYEEGEEFYFGQTEVYVVAKIPNVEEIFKETLFSDEYGFTLNDEETIYTDVSEIVMTKEVTSVFVVWLDHPTIKAEIAVTVGGDEQAEGN